MTDCFYRNMHINQALSAYGADGWSIMHTNDLDYLYNAWYNINTFTNNVDVESFTTSVDNTLEVEFYEMFGCTVGPNYCDRTFSDDSVWSYTDQNGSNESGALILGESDKIIGAYVRDFSYYKATNISGEIQYGGYNRLARAYDFRTTSLDFNSTLAGVGLVRKIGAVDVPEPSSLAILILGIISLGWRRKING